MKTRHKIFLILVATLMCSSCATYSYRLIEDLSQPFELEGFSIKPPQDFRWTIGKQNNQEVIFYRDHEKEDKDHTIMASAQTDLFDLETLDRLEAFVRLYPTGRGRRVKPLEVNVERIRFSEQDAVVCKYRANDYEVPGREGEAFLMASETVYLIHPYSSGNKIIVLHASQRLPEGERFLNLENEVRPFFESLEFKRFLDEG